MPGTSTAAKQEYLEAAFLKADADGDGTVDFDEFVSFYSAVLLEAEAENAARDAFAKYDIDGSNTLEKHELFAVRRDRGLHSISARWTFGISARWSDDGGHFRHRY